MPSAHARFADDFIFQQDNASIHTSRETKEFFQEHDVEVLEWPALSPDLNPIENVWGKLAQAVYANGKQYDTKEDLKRAILFEWDALLQEYLATLIRAMKKRCIDVIKAIGGSTKH